MTNPVSIPATISKVTTMADHTLRLQVDTQEIAPDIKSELFSLHEKLGYFFFAEEAIRRIDKTKLPEITLETGEKSPSERLRNVLYVFWEAQKVKEPFDIFYRRTIDKYIQSIKEKLP